MKKKFSQFQIAAYFCLLYFAPTLLAQKGIVTVPVADLVGQPMKSYYSHKPAEASYSSLPWACYGRHFEACPRVHQLVYHEVVDILSYQADEVEIAIPQLYYQTINNAKPQNCYWTLKKNIIPFNALKQKGVDSRKIPEPICFSNNNSLYKPNCISLVEPYSDPILPITYSAGTRFILAEKQPAKPNLVAVYRLHPQKLILQTILIPSKLIYGARQQAAEKKVIACISILRRWANTNKGIIPYVWGGCSYIDRHSTNNFSLSDIFLRGKSLRYYARTQESNAPKTGYDCASIIARAAHIVGLPYFYKNSYTIAKQLPELQKGERLQVGDIIWMNGHVIIISSIAQNSIIEAHSYDGGYGRVHEMPLSKTFQDIITVADLEKSFFSGKPLYRLNSKGGVQTKYSSFKLLRFAGQWS